MAVKRQLPHFSSACGPGTEEKTPVALLPMAFRNPWARLTGNSASTARRTSSSAGAALEDFSCRMCRSAESRASPALGAPVAMGSMTKQSSFLIVGVAPPSALKLTGTQNLQGTPCPELAADRARAKHAATTALTVAPRSLATAFTRANSTGAARAARFEPASVGGLSGPLSRACSSCSTAWAGARKRQPSRSARVARPA
mmetsp:Transcript_29418/g.77795  ORF Transcript_29418/g.77795 Transcript_29418/m.77795 type:complete len:200 (-) Transcript_29418:157-756(-)